VGVSGDADPRGSTLRACVWSALPHTVAGMLPYWCCARLHGRQERLATHCLGLAGHTVYQPRIRSPRRGCEPLFPTYVFVTVGLQWHTVRWAPGVVALLMGVNGPARVADHVIEELKSRERDGQVVLPAALRPRPLARFKAGDQVKVVDGPLRGFKGLISGLKPHERVAVLLELLGGQRPIEMAAADVERAWS
jgi:transcription antitermination factor NusG